MSPSGAFLCFLIACFTCWCSVGEWMLLKCIFGAMFTSMVVVTAFMYLQDARGQILQTFHFRAPPRCARYRVHQDGTGHYRYGQLPQDLEAWRSRGCSCIGWLLVVLGPILSECAPYHVNTVLFFYRYSTQSCPDYSPFYCTIV